MALPTKRLKNCKLEVEPLINDDWLAKFFDDDGYEWSARVNVQNGRLLQTSLSLNDMRLKDGGLVPFSYIKEEEQEQRILDAISQATASLKTNLS